MKKKQKVAIFDIDGTIFRSSLLIEVTEAMINEGIFGKKLRKIYAGPYKNWLERKGGYEEYIRGVVKAFEDNLPGVKMNDFSRVAKEVADFHKDRVYRYTRDLVRDLKKKGYFLLAISNSPKIILDEFCGNLGFDKVYGRIYEIDKKGGFTGITLYEDLMANKERILMRAMEKGGFSFKGSVGVGDTESDIPFLKRVEKPICFNPNKNLFDYAKKVGWKIVAERKDVIYHL